MSKNILYFIFGLIFAVLLIIIGFLLLGKKHTAPIQERHKISKTKSPTYTIVDSSSSPKTSGALTQEEILRETGTSDNSLQRFVVKSTLDGSTREIFGVNESDVTFEKIKPENWSPTNKFLFVYIDYADRRDVIFLKTDGKFTSGNYYLHSTGLYPTMNVQNAKWIDNQTLELDSKDMKTNLPQKYSVSFDDDTGIVAPE